MAHGGGGGGRGQNESGLHGAVMQGHAENLVIMICRGPVFS
jgi:hypothetical protein